jgi:hypothetical protein
MRSGGDPENKVLVELGLEFDPDKADAEIKALRAQLEKATANYEREVADGKRVRAESASLRAQIRIARSRSPRTIASPPSCARS